MFLLVQQGLPWLGFSTKDSRRIPMAREAKLRGTWDSWPEILCRICRWNRSCCWRVRSSMGTAWWSNPQTNASEPRKEDFCYIIISCVYSDNILFCSFPNTIFSPKLFLGSNPHHMLACINVMMINVHHLKTIDAWFPWHFCGHRICWWQMA